MNDMIAKIRKLVKSWEKELFLALCLLLTAGIGFNIGLIRAERASASTPTQATAYEPLNSSPATSKTPTPTPDQRVVVSKTSGSKVYHYSWCSGAKTISAKNQVWYVSAAAAETAGYTLAANCKP